MLIVNTAAAKLPDITRQNYKAYQKRISLASKQLKKNGTTPDKITVIGYYFGGSGALEAAREKITCSWCCFYSWKHRKRSEQKKQGNHSQNFI